MRPSLVFGPEDSFFNRFAGMARISPFLPLIGGGETRFQPVFAGDVGRAVAKAVAGEVAPGVDVQTDEQWDAWLRAQITTEFHPSSSCSMLASGVRGSSPRLDEGELAQAALDRKPLWIVTCAEGGVLLGKGTDGTGGSPRPGPSDLTACSSSSTSERGSSRAQDAASRRSSSRRRTVRCPSHSVPPTAISGAATIPA